MRSKVWNSDREVPFDKALAAYKRPHAAYMAGGLNNGVTRTADARAFEDLADARLREGRPWTPEDYR